MLCRKELNLSSLYCDNRTDPNSSPLEAHVSARAQTIVRWTLLPSLAFERHSRTTFMSSFYPGKRLSIKGERCTVRYVGEVKGKQGQWLGVEWDDPTRGKHSGTHEGFEYFKCRSSAQLVLDKQI